MKFQNFAAALALGLLTGFGWSVSASAQQTDVNLFDDDGNLIQSDITEFDWSSRGSGVAKGIGPFGTPLVVGQEFDFSYQSNLVNLDGSVPTGLVTTSNGGTIGGSGDFQYTIVANIHEEVTAFTPIPGGQLIGFSILSGTVSIFYDDGDLANTQGNTGDGTGFDDGTEIARLTVESGTSNFTVEFDPDEGTGSSSVHFELTALTDFVNEDFLEGILGAVADLEFESNQQFPSGTSQTTGFHIGGSAFYPDYVVDPDSDIVLKVDGSNTFTTQVPEPGTLGLLGAGILGLCAIFRRRFSAAA